MKSVTLIIKIFVGLVILGGLTQLILVNNSSSTGSQISKLEREQTALNSDILDLNNQLASVTSLDNIQAQALKLGMARVGSNFEFLPLKTVAVSLHATP